MKKFTYTIKSEIGVHVKPASALSKVTEKYMSKIFITKDEKSADASKILEIMSLAIKEGDKITVTVYGDDEVLAADNVKKFIKENF